MSTRTLPALLLVLAGIASISAYLFVFRDPTDDADWKRAADWIEHDFGENDAFRVHPYWNDGPLVHFRNIGDRRLPQRTPLYEDLYTYDRVWIATPRGRRDEALKMLGLGDRPSRERDFDTVTAMAVDVHGPPIVWEAYDHVKEAKVWHVRKGKAENCSRWNSRKHRLDCTPADRWFWVGQTMQEVGDEPRRCVWAQPIEKGGFVRVEFPRVPAGKTLRIRAGFSLRAARSGRGKDIALRIFVNGRERTDRRIAHDDQRYPAYDVDVSDHDGPNDLELEVESLASARDRYFCVNAWVFGADERQSSRKR